MATLDVDVTQDWVDIKTSLSLRAGKTYIVDNVSGGVVYVREGSVTPTSNVGHTIELRESRLVTITSESLWVKANQKSAKIVLTQEA